MSTKDIKKKGLLIICNHLSYIDPPLLVMFLPIRDTVFAINPKISSNFFTKPFLKIVPTIPVDTNNPIALKMLIQYLKDGKNIVIFPEGRTSTTGSLMKFYLGTAIVASSTQANILPVNIRGTEKTIFSRLKNQIRHKKKFFQSEITMHVGKMFQLKKTKFNSKTKERNNLLSQLYNALRCTSVESSSKYNNLFKVIVKQSSKYGVSKKILGDLNKVISYKNLIYNSIYYYKFIFNYHKLNTQNKTVAILLQNSLELFYSIFAVSLSGANKLILSYQVKIKEIINSCKNLNIKLLITSKNLITCYYSEVGHNLLKSSDINVLYIEDIRTDKIQYILYSKFYSWCSGCISLKESNFIFRVSEKLYELFSDKKIQTNALEISSQIDIRYDDVFLTSQTFSSTDGVVLGILAFINNRVGYVIDDYKQKQLTSFIYLKNITLLFSSRVLLQESLNYYQKYNFYRLRLIFLKHCNYYYNFRDYFYNHFKGKTEIRSYLKQHFSTIIALDSYLYYHQYDCFPLLFSNANTKIQNKEELVKNSPEIFANKISNNKGYSWLNFNEFVKVISHFLENFSFNEGFLISNYRLLFNKIYKTQDFIFISIYNILINHTNLEFNLFREFDAKKQTTLYKILLPISNSSKVASVLNEHISQLFIAFQDEKKSFFLDIQENAT